MVKLGLGLLFILFFSQCISSKRNNDELCKRCNQRSAELINEFYTDNDSLHLDSALFYIDEALGHCKDYEKLLSLRKLSIFSMKKDFEQALIFIDKLGDDIVDLPYYKKLLTNRFKAMQSMSLGNIERRNYYLKAIIGDVDNYLYINKKSVDSIMRLTDIRSILKNHLSTTLTQHYYYRSILEGKEKIKAEILNVPITTGKNKEFYDYLAGTLDENLMIFIGI